MINTEEKNNTRTPQAKSLTDKKQDTSGSSGLIFVSAQPNQGEEGGPQDLENVLNTFFCHENQNENLSEDKTGKVDELKVEDKNNADILEQQNIVVVVEAEAEVGETKAEEAELQTATV